jgi:hypothetical protein
MPKLKCPIDECEWESQDLAVELAAVLTVALQAHLSRVHPTDPAAAVKPEKLNRPAVGKGCTSEDWGYFSYLWTSYKTATKLPVADTNVQLLACCDADLRKDLHRTDKEIEQQPEDAILTAIKSLAVRRENVMVSRLALHGMCQDREEGVRNYAARLKGQADVCNFIVRCPCNPPKNVNFTDQMVRDVLIRGLNDQDIQHDILGHENEAIPLEDVIKLVEAKEAGRRSQASLMVEGAHGVSQHKRAKSGQFTQKSEQSTPPDRKAKCEKCSQSFTRPLGRGGRFRPFKLCKSCFTSKSGAPERDKRVEESSNVYDMLCMASTAISNAHGKKKINLFHHVFNDDTGWQQRRSQSQPAITILARVCKDDYTHFGVTLASIPKGGPITAIADTGCQSCLIGLKLVYRLGLRKSDLLTVQHKMNAVNRNSINIIGAVLLRLSGYDKGGYPMETAQICYVTPDTGNMYLSREACVGLGLISPTFPAVGEVRDARDARPDTAAPVYHPEAGTDDEWEKCKCPRRCMPPPPPTALPFAATEENVSRLRQWLLDFYASSTFNVCPHNRLPLMAGPPLALMVDPEARPVAIHTPIPVPIHWQEEVKAGLDRDVRLGVIETVPVGDPVTWCHRMVVCRKKNGTPRRTVDLQALNSHCSRETHHTQSPFHQARSVPSGKKKSVFDAWNGYHSVPIRECDRHLTTFITPWGRYRYRTTPQGYIASGDGYTRRFDEIAADFPNKTKCIDDTCMWGDSVEDCFFQACDWLDICGKNGITLNPEKFSFAQDTVEFAGFEITPDEVRPCNRYVDAIKQFPTPLNITDIRSWFGLVNQVSYYTSMSERMRPFRDLLKPKSPFYWDSQLQQLFEESKESIVQDILQGVRIFDTGRKTCLTTDWSKEGLGFFLLQKHCVCPGDMPFCCTDGWKVTLVGSRFTHPAESRYAPIEGEALAVADALERTRYFTLGCDDLIVAVDHQPLLKILGDRKLEDIKNPRLFNLKEKTLPFKFKIVHIPGKKNLATDALSRHPTRPEDTAMLELPDDAHAALACKGDDTPSCKEILSMLRTEEADWSAAMDAEITAAAALSLEGMTAVTWDRIREATTSDPVMFSLLETIEDGMPDSQMLLPPQLREYFTFREHLSTADGVVLYKDRILVPPALRDEVLTALHAAHQGVTSMSARASMSVFWPGITNHITRLRNGCMACNRISPSQPCAPPTTPIDPEFPFQCICADYFSHKGSHYLIIVDRYSNWPIVKRTSGGAAGLVKSLREEFITYGIAEEIASDGGPEFVAAETQEFLRSWGVKHRLSSVAFPHSNCRAEIGVKSCKRLLMDNTGPNGELDTPKLQRAMLQYRNTPDQDTKMSPAMIVFGRSIRDFIPVLPGHYKPHQAWADNAGLRESALRKRHTRAEERLTEHTKQLPPLRVGDHVRIQNQHGRDPNKWDKTGLVVEVRQHDQYVVRVDGSSRVTLRNRKFLRRFQLYCPSIHSPITTPQYPATPSHAAHHQHVPSNLPARCISTQSMLPPPVARAALPFPQTPRHPLLQRNSAPPRALGTPRVTPTAPSDRRLYPVEPPAMPLVNYEGGVTNTAPPHVLPTEQPLDGTEGPAPAERVAETPTPVPRTVRPKRNIIPPARYDPKEWDLSGRK